MKILALTGLCVAFASFAIAQDRKPGASTPMTEKKDVNSVNATEAFLTEVAEGGTVEVELGKLASQKASNPKVKSFGEQMVTDHGAANDQVRQLAARKQISLPTDMNQHEKAEYDRLSKLSGAAFDRAYITLMVNDHQKDVAAFRKQSAQGEDADVKAFATKTLPTLEQHLSLVQSIQKELGHGTNSSW